MKSEAFFDLPQKNSDLEKIDEQLASPEIWEDQNRLQTLQRNKKALEKEIGQFSRISEKKEELEVLAELIEEGEDVRNEITKNLADFNAQLEEAQLQALFDTTDDPRNAILTIHPGAGGTESQDWAQMLLRMYLRYAERKSFKAEVLDMQPGEEAGLKSATVRVVGDHAFGNLSQESGVHRLVRISPFDANKRRHTSFAAVFVYPEIEDDIEIDINPADVRVDTYRASGAGGQHVNRTDSAVRLTHLPTNTVVQCQSERSQHQNKDKAYKQLRAKLYELEMLKRRAEQQEIEDNKADIGWGSQIRSYVLDQSRVKDLRTQVERTDPNNVLDGDIDDLIEASLKAGL